ncbi:hypothetical protein AX15_006619 [Amanita polypyramis BW_CC]|nr:hypothetical protein AX15_006619 [Amanita polypyramis BW_CC]
MSAAPVSDVKHLKHHLEYYLQDGNAHILVENTIFRIHSYFLTRESPIFRIYLEVPVGHKQERKGTSDSNALVLENVTTEEFATFLWVFYDPKFVHSTTVGNWTTILDLADRWKFSKVKTLAVGALEELTIPLINRIALYQKYNISEDVIVPHYAALCARQQMLNLKETEAIGMPTTIMILTVREQILTSQNGIKSLEQLEVKSFQKAVGAYRSESQKKKVKDNQQNNDKSKDGHDHGTSGQPNGKVN